MTNVSDSTLTRLKVTTETFQTYDITLDNAERLMESLHSYVASQRDPWAKYKKYHYYLN